MLSFALYLNGKPAERVNLAGAYVVGSDDIPLRAEITFRDGIITCKKRAAGPAGLALLWPLPGVGTIMLETVRLLERDEPYLLQVELARGRLLRINQKLEDWGLFNYEGADAILAQVTSARDSLIRALQADTPAEAAAHGEAALAPAVQASESLSRFHAEVFLERRKQSGGLPRRPMGCSIHPDNPPELIAKRLAGAFDFVTVPIVWRDIEPSEQTFNWKSLDTWVETLGKQRIPMKGSPLLSLSEWNVPDWLHIWENDFDTIRDLAFQHCRRVINRYGQYIQTWDVISGIHANNSFAFNFEQLMELTRMTAALTKQACPRGVAIVDLVAPWGEYYARNQRTIPPLLYADMVSQSSVNFDAFGLQFHFGPAVDGMFVRDMFQISSQIDLFAKLGKPLNITAIQVPSDTTPGRLEGGNGERRLEGGTWHEPWSEEVQSEWLRQFVKIAFSKPFVESVSWCDLVDRPNQPVLHGGLLRSDGVPKAAYRQCLNVRSELLGRGRRTARDKTV